MECCRATCVLGYYKPVGQDMLVHIAEATNPRELVTRHQQQHLLHNNMASEAAESAESAKEHCYLTGPS